MQSKPELWQREWKIRVAVGFASQGFVYAKKRQASLQALDSKAKLPVQSRAVEASNKLLHVIWMRPELPVEQSEDPGPV